MAVVSRNQYTKAVWTFPIMLGAALAAEPEPPRLVSGLQPAYPSGALADGRAAEVLLSLSLDESGAVVGVEVAQSAGAAFDAAAEQAARSFVFTPTTVDGAPVPVTVGYRVVFQPTRAPPVSAEGEVLEAGTRQPLAAFSITFRRGEQALSTETDAEGAFRVAGLDPGVWTLSSSAEGFRLDPVDLEVKPGRVAEARLFAVLDRPWADARDVDESVVVVGRRVTPEITERVLSAEQARYLPGTNGDVVRVVQNLPGVARPPLNIGQLIIRGTAPEDSRYYLDGAEIPLVFHFAGLSTVVNADAIGEIAFLPGNYGVRYGRTLGGAVDLRVDPTLPERSSGYASVDLFQATGFIEQKLGDRLALAVSGRRSYVDAVLTPVLSSLGSSTVQAPRYYDLQLRLYGRTRAGGSLETLFLVSDDRFAVIGEDADDEPETTIGLVTAFQKARLLWREDVGSRWRHEVSVIAGPQRQTFDLAPEGRALESAFTLGVRDELFRAPGDGPGWRLGVDLQVGEARFDYDVPGFGPRERARVLRFAPAAYLEPTFAIGAVDVVPGIRVDGLTLGGTYQSVTADPRLAVRAGRGATTVKASTGLYSQWPTPRQAVEQAALGPARSWQSALGVEQQLGPDVDVEVNGFANQLWDLVSGREDAFRFFSGPPPVGPLDVGPYANEGTGSILGVEGLLKVQTARTTAWVSATVSRSTRIDREGEDRALFEYDQPIVLTALASHQLPRRWRLGVRARYGSGNPYTPVVNRFQTFDQRGFAPVYGARDSARLPAFWQLDVRVDKDWVFKKWQLTAYLDLQNATNAQNVEVIGWTYDFAEEDPVTQIPVVPAFGVRGEW